LHLVGEAAVFERVREFGVSIESACKVRDGVVEVALPELGHPSIVIGGRNIGSYFASAAPILAVLAAITMLQLSGVFLPWSNLSEGGIFIFLPLYSFVVFCFSLVIASFSTFQRYHRGILTVCLLGAAGSILIDVAYPQTFSKIAERPAGFEENSNHAAMIVVIRAAPSAIKPSRYSHAARENASR
jgi:hypothetical protein